MSPEATIGIVGGGQLARMMCQAARPLGVRTRVLAERPDDSAVAEADEVVVGGPDLDGLLALAEGSDVVTLDHEHAGPADLTELERRGHVVRPPPAAALLGHDKLVQRDRLSAAGLAVPSYARLGGLPDLEAFAEGHGWPLVVKAARGGYDGRGVWVARDLEDARRLLAEVRDVTLYVEEHVAFDEELAILAARRPGGEAVTYPLVTTVQEAGICRELLAPAPVPPAMAAEATRVAEHVAAVSGAVGIVAVELFAVAGRLLVNELAFRPHNSGHWTIEGSVTSQFENHVRAVLDWPLGDTAARAQGVVTVNVLGPADGSAPDWPRGREHGAHVHDYGKAARPGRKLGHVTVLGDDLEAARAAARAAAGALVEVAA